MLTIVTGALAGLFHVLSGPDHLAAVAPLAVADERRGWLSGWTWGAGHASGVAVVAVAAVLLRDLLPPIELISTWGERLVGVALIAIGLWALQRSIRIQPRAHTARRAHASFWIGILHGVAGSSHFFGVLPALALPTRGAALSYIAAFGVGTIVAMTAFAAAVGVAGQRLPHAAGAQRGMFFAAAMLALIVGGVWLFGGPSSIL